jgi:hypothetical protein
LDREITRGGRRRVALRIDRFQQFIGGKFGSFPHEFKDGTGGIIEIESTGFAAGLQ